MLVDWGVQQARKEGVPAYVEAASSAKSLYEKIGFKQIGELVLDLRAYGNDMGLVLARMVADAEDAAAEKK